MKSPGLAAAVSQLIQTGLIYLVVHQTGEVVAVTTLEYMDGSLRLWERGQPFMLLENAMAAAGRIRRRS